MILCFILLILTDQMMYRTIPEFQFIKDGLRTCMG
jgi:hypothetical protein